MLIVFCFLFVKMIIYISPDLLHIKITHGAFNKDINARLLPSDSDLIGLDWGTSTGIF